MTTTPVKTVTLTIDGQQVTVPEGTLVIRAAEQIGVQIPRFCDHPLLTPVGACRQCLVDITDAGNGRGFPKPQASCTIPAADGMIVYTQNDKAAKAQAGIMEFLLLNHPLDCPVCDKGGECPLQNQAMSNGYTETRALPPEQGESGYIKRTFPKPIPVSPNILLDRERCVSCARCTRFADQIPGDKGLVLIERGGQQQVGTADDEPFSSYFSGNVIQICPVGALTSAEYRFRARPFDLVSTPSVAEHDACGAAIRVDHRHGTVMRRLAGNDPLVNEEWITDKDRFAFQYLLSEHRLRYPMIREDGELRPASWVEAFSVAAAGLRASGAVGVLPGGRGTLEDQRAYAFLARKVLGTDDIDFRSRPLSAEETAFLLKHVDGAPPPVTYADLEAASVVVIAGLEPEDEAGTIFLRLRKANRETGLKIVALSPFTTWGLQKMGAEVVRTAPGDEAAAIAALDLPEGAVVLAGERLATSPGALTAVSELVEKSGAKLGWVPRRAGDRGAVRARCIPQTGGRDADQIIAATNAGEIDTLVIGGVDPDDTSDPAAFRTALRQARFVISLELRETDVTRSADVVFPVAPVTEKAGTFVTWESRERIFPQIIERPGSLSDAEVLTRLVEVWESTPDALPSSADSSRTMPSRHESAETTNSGVGVIRDESASFVTSRRFRLATWKLMLDNGVMQEGDKALAATARPAVARVSQAVFERVGPTVTITGDRGSVTLPAEVADIDDDVVWVPANSFGKGVLASLASPGSKVDVEGAGV